MTTMRAKLLVTNVESHTDSPSWPHEKIKFIAVSDKPFDEGGNSEDNSYARWTPSADLNMQINNPNLFGKLIVGEKYHLDFTPAQ